MNSDGDFNFMFDFAYELSHNFESDFDLIIVVDSVFTVLHQGLRHPHFDLRCFLSYVEDFENYGILSNYIFDLKNLGFVSYDLFSRISQTSSTAWPTLIIAGRSCQVDIRFT